MECLELPRNLKNLVRDMEPGCQPGDEYIKQAVFGILVDSGLFCAGGDPGYGKENIPVLGTRPRGVAVFNQDGV